MSDPKTPESEITAREQKFLDGLKKLYEQDGDGISVVEQRVYDATHAKLSEKGEATIADITETGQTVINDMYLRKMDKANELYKSTAHNLNQLSKLNGLDEEQRKPAQQAYEAAGEAVERVRADLRRDIADLSGPETYKLAQQVGLSSGIEITGSEVDFLKKMKKTLEKNEDFSDANKDLYEALRKLVSGKGEATLEQIAATVDKVQGNESQQAGSDKTPITGGEAVPADEVTANVLAIAKKSGIKSSGRE